MKNKNIKHHELLIRAIYVKNAPEIEDIGKCLTSSISFIEEYSFTPLSDIFQIIEPLLREEDKELVLHIFQKSEQSPALPWSNARRAAAEMLCAAFLFKMDETIPKKEMTNAFIAISLHYYALGGSDGAEIRKPLYGWNSISSSIRHLHAIEEAEKDQILDGLDQIRRRTIWNYLMLMDHRSNTTMQKQSVIEQIMSDIQVISIFGLSYERLFREIISMEEEMKEQAKEVKISSHIKQVSNYELSPISEKYFGKQFSRNMKHVFDKDFN